MKLSVVRVQITQLIASLALWKRINEWNLSAWFHETWCWQTSTQWAKCPNRWATWRSGHARRSACALRWNPSRLRPKSKQESTETPTHYWESPHLGTCPQQPPAALNWHSRTESRFIQEITCQTRAGSRRFCGKAARQSVKQLPWTKRHPVHDLEPHSVLHICKSQMSSKS